MRILVPHTWIIKQCEHAHTHFSHMDNSKVQEVYKQVHLMWITHSSHMENQIQKCTQRSTLYNNK